MESDVVSGSFNGILAGSEQFLCFILGKLRKAAEFLLFTSAYIGIMAVAMTYTSSSLQNLPWNPSAAIILSFVVFSVYNLNRKTDAAEDALNHAGRFRFTSRFGRPLFLSALAAYGGALILAAAAGPASALLAAVPLLAGIIYSVPLLSGFCRYQRVKEIPVMKNIVVSGSWAIAFSFLPAFLAGTFPDVHSLVVFALIFEYVFIASVLPDIRDREGDAATHVYTIPVLIGVEKTRLFLTAFNLVVAAFLLTIGSLCLPPTAWVILLISFIYSQFCILSVGQTRFDNFLIDVISDGEFLFIGILFCILNTGFPAL
ncbi:MAG: UbiA family prenyltransferase [Methanoregula sp.]|jgi:4-hydroxybenzoate polyprenyltransferase|nr:UbiA family prenyltransferase [Methanoregula sp.]